MRTDAKIGFAIGGVLLAVLTVYAIVVPKHKNTKGTVAVVTTPSTPTGADTPVTTPTPLIGTPEGSGQTQPPAPVKDSGTTGSLVLPPSLQLPVTPPGNSDNATGGLAGNLVKPDEMKPDAPAPEHVSTGRTKPEKKFKTAPFDVTDAATSSDHLYTIKPGQTLSKIAYEVYGNSRFYVAIQRENKGLDPNHLKVGSSIKLPDITPVQPGSAVVSDDHSSPLVEVTPPHVLAPPVMAATDGHTYTVQPGDNLYAIARKLLGSGRKADSIYALNKDLIGPDKSRLKLGMTLKLPEGGHPAIAE
jgi:nucleoid-associated protein YgaU